MFKPIDRSRSFTLAALLAAAAAGAVVIPSALADGTLDLSNEHGKLHVIAGDDGAFTATLDDKPLTWRNFVEDGEFIRVVNADEAPMFTIARLPGGRLFGSTDGRFNGPIGGLVVAAGHPGHEDAAPAPAQRERVRAIAAPRAPGGGDGESRIVFNGNEDGNRYTIVIKDGQIVSARLNDEDVPQDRIIREGDVIILRGADGERRVRVETLQGSGLGGGMGQGAGTGRAHAAAKQLAELAELAVVARPRVMIGVTMGQVDDSLAGHLGVNKDDVVLITGVLEGKPAERAGLKRNDVILRIDGADKVTAEALRDAVQSRNPGDELRLRVLSAGQERDVVIRVEPSGDEAPGAGQEGQMFLRRGDQAARMEDLARRLREQQGAIRERVRTRVDGETARRMHEEIMKSLADQNVTIDAETRRKIAEALEKAAKAMEEAGAAQQFNFDFEFPEIELFDGDGPGGVVVLPRTPMPPPPPGAGPSPERAPLAPGEDPGRRADLNRRLDRLEERMGRLEELLQRLAEKP